MSSLNDPLILNFYFRCYTLVLLILFHYRLQKPDDDSERACVKHELIPNILQKKNDSEKMT